MFVFGGAVLWGLFEAPRVGSPRSPGLPWGAPVRPVRFVSIEFGGQAGVSDSLVKQVVALDPDYVLVQNIRFDDVLPLAEALGMARSYHPALFQRPDPRSKDQPGDLVLSKFPLYDAKPIMLDADPTHVHHQGVQATAVSDGSRFVLLSGVGATDESLKALDAARKQSNSPAMIVATGFVRPQKGEGSYRCDLSPTVSLTQEVGQEGPLVPVATVYADPGWVMVKGDVFAGPPMILYTELKAWTPAAAAATRPWR
jgi:hypothetical protein